MELGCIAVAAWAAVMFSGDALWASVVLGWMLLSLSVCDLTSFRLPDALTLPLLLIGLAVTGWQWAPALTDHALAAVVGCVSLQVTRYLYRFLRGREGLGGGDAKLMGAAGAWVGLAGLPLVLLIAALTGLGVAAALAVRNGWNARRALPFGPCIALGVWVVWLYA